MELCTKEGEGVCGAIHHHRCLKDKSFFVKKGSHSTIYPNPKYHNKSGKLDLCNILYSIGVVFKINFEKAYDKVAFFRSSVGEEGVQS